LKVSSYGHPSVLLCAMSILLHYLACLCFVRSIHKYLRYSTLLIMRMRRTSRAILGSHGLLHSVLESACCVSRHRYLSPILLSTFVCTSVPLYIPAIIIIKSVSSLYGTKHNIPSLSAATAILIGPQPSPYSKAGSAVICDIDGLLLFTRINTGR
jgi:hypothetical protein